MMGWVILYFIARTSLDSTVCYRVEGMGAGLGIIVEADLGRNRGKTKLFLSCCFLRLRKIYVLRKVKAVDDLKRTVC